MIILKTAIDAFIKVHSSFTTGAFADMLRSNSPEVGRSTVYHILKQLCESGEIIRTSKGHYKVAGKKNYAYDLSDTAKDISSVVHKEFPLVDFQVWELYQMNEFVNHQLARNTVFIEVEDLQEESIFNLLFEKYPHVLLNPGVDEYYKYAGQETILVRKLISEAPPAFGSYHQASLEKILVDLFGRGISGAIVSRSEYSAIFETAFKKYNINQAKMSRYARRRGIEKTIRDYLSENTNITSEDFK